MKRKFVDVILAFGLLITVVSAFAHTWEKTSSTVDYGSIGISADGRIICAVPSGGHPYISTNSGKTWFVATNSQWGSLSLSGVAVSANGAKIFTALASATIPKTSILLSQDQCATWAFTGFPDVNSSTQYCVACSADGTKVIAALNSGPLLYSTNGGVNCYTSSVPAKAWMSLASSTDGSRMVAAANPGSVYFSEDFGATWTPTNLPNAYWLSVCISSDGKTIGAVANRVFISTNAGVTWRTNAITGHGIGCSADGNTWIVAGSQIYTSTDGGVTWQGNLASAQWNSGVVSADGAEMVAMGSGQGTWLGREIPSPQLNIHQQSSTLLVSWLVPSTNFVLQQSTDIAAVNWTPVTNNPALNFTNLNQEVSVPTTASNAFFRLIAQ